MVKAGVRSQAQLRVREPFELLISETSFEAVVYSTVAQFLEGGRFYWSLTGLRSADEEEPEALHSVLTLCLDRWLSSFASVSSRASIMSGSVM